MVKTAECPNNVRTKLTNFVRNLIFQDLISNVKNSFLNLNQIPSALKLSVVVESELVKLFF